MIRELDNNQADPRKFAISLGEFMSADAQLAVKSIKTNYRYDKNTGNRTDECIGYTVTCTNTKTFEALNIKVPSNFNLTNDELESTEALIYLKVDLETTMVYPWKIEYGRAHVVIEASKASIIRK